MLTRGIQRRPGLGHQLDKDNFAGRTELAWQHDDGSGMRLVGMQPVDGSVLRDEASQIIEAGNIAGRITSNRMSPALGRSICLAQLEARLAVPAPRSRAAAHRT